MNIFYLSENPEECAKQHVDRHAVKMILESAQMLCTAVRVLGGTKTELVDPLGKSTTVYLLPDETYEFIEEHKMYLDTEETYITYKLKLSSRLYIQTHVNHPCAVWVRESWTNFNYLTMLMLELEKEWQFRFRHTKGHKSVVALTECNILALACQYFPSENKSKGLTPPALAMPDKYKTDCPIQSYRNYYNFDKHHLHKWTNRETPWWIHI